ncbi:hypothetical protein ACJMK2_043489, partial [Sinanodonta woodiana]
MERIESTNISFLENSTTNDTFTTMYNESEYAELNGIQDFLNSANTIFEIVLGLITVTGLVGNILTVAVILRNKGIKSITDILVLTLAVTDILSIVFAWIVLSYDITELPFGHMWCQLIKYVIFTSTFV